VYMNKPVPVINLTLRPGCVPFLGHIGFDGMSNGEQSCLPVPQKNRAQS
jgi:hypothetical protein